MEITIDKETLLDLICCAEDYGFNDDVLMYSFADMMKSLSDEEIEVFARKIEATDDYSHEDYEITVDKLEEFRENYLTN